jgi:hypothetical protein
MSEAWKLIVKIIFVDFIFSLVLCVVLYLILRKKRGEK